MSTPAVIVDNVLKKGGILRVSGSDIVVDAPAKSLSPDTIEALRRNKTEILELLTGEGGCITPQFRAQQRNSLREWTAEDWRAFYNERAAIAEHEAGLSRADAEARAYECCVVRWLNENPPPNPGTDTCVGCGSPVGRIGADAVPVLAGERHVWVHHECHARFMAQRRRAAVAKLATLLW